MDVIKFYEETMGGARSFMQMYFNDYGYEM